MNAARMAVWIGLLCSASVALAQTANIYIDVKRQATSKGASTRYQGYYMADKDYARTVDLAVTVKNMNQQPVTFDLEYYFIAKTANGNLKWSYDGGTQTLALAKAAHTNMTITSKELQSSKTESYYSKTETGSKYEGYIFRALVAGKVVQVNASSRQLETAARNEKELESLIEAAEEGRKQVRDYSSGAVPR
ncbi:MAG: hypothetical protein FJ221_02350 [Lentisphaerae bacterium]|nr:hypothetical protein [Lentisphaerota bacterium]